MDWHGHKTFATPCDQIKLIPWNQHSFHRDPSQSVLKRLNINKHVTLRHKTFATPCDQIKLIQWKQYSLQRDPRHWHGSILKRFSLRVSSLCPLLSHSDCGIIYFIIIFQNVTYNIIFRTPELLSVFKREI